MGKLCPMAFLCLLPLAAQAVPPRYRITRLETPPGYEESRATCLNDQGEVAGYLTARSHRSARRQQGTTAVVWTHGRATLLPSLPSPDGLTHEPDDAVASGINNGGQIVGTLSYFFDGAWMGTDLQAVLWQHGKLIKIPRLNGLNQNTAVAINDVGQVAGTADDDFISSEAPPHLYLYDQHQSKDLGIGIATGMNEDGRVCGYVFLDSKGVSVADQKNVNRISQVRALLCSPDGTRTLLGNGYALNLNDGGDVSGTTEDAVGPYGPISVRSDLTEGLTHATATRAKVFSHDHHTTEIVSEVKTDAYHKSRMMLWPTGLGRSRPVPLPFHWLPQAINARGQVVGSHWLWQKGRASDLNRCIPHRPGWRILCAAAINRRGQIAGYGRVHGRLSAFLMTPVSPK